MSSGIVSTCTGPPVGGSHISPPREIGANTIDPFGGSYFMVVRTLPANASPKTPHIDHLGYTIENWDGPAVEAELREEVERWRLQDPIERVKRAAVDRGVMRTEDIAALEQQIEALIDEAVDFAKNSPDPTPDQLITDIYA